MDHPPLDVTVTRDPVVESRHRVDAVIAGPEGVVTSWGQADRPTLARSGLKLVQALPLVRTGAADRFGLSPEELTLACSSHNGEPAHIERVTAWLKRIGLDESALECGPALPRPESALVEHLQAGGQSTRVAHNCSGKHTGFLTVARHLGVDPGGYVEPDHPVQVLVTEALSELCQVDVSDQQPGRDGCGIPTWAVPLAALAGAMARLVQPTGARPALAPETVTAAGRLVEAVAPRAWWLSGTGRHEVEVADQATEPVVLKAGAEGVFMGALPGQGLGIAVKAADGAARAAEVGISAVLAHLGALPSSAVDQVVHNSQGLAVGSISTSPVVC